MAAEEVAAWLRRVGTEQLGGCAYGTGSCALSDLTVKGTLALACAHQGDGARAIGHVVRVGRERPGQGAVVVDRDPVTLL